MRLKTFGSRHHLNADRESTDLGLGSRPDVRFGSKADIRTAKGACPLYPQKQTCVVQLAMSALGQKRTLPAYSMISSARPINDNGTVRPRALAVLRLMISSTLVACWTGRSAGFSPLRTRPV
jgi:hypothetical protein